MMLVPLLALHLSGPAVVLPARSLWLIARSASDGGPIADAGEVDAGPEVDAGTIPDAGAAVDAGAPVDAGAEPDAGPDAGPPPITDAGPPPPPIDAGPNFDGGQGLGDAPVGDQTGDANVIPAHCAVDDDCPVYWQCIATRCQPGTTGKTKAANFGCSTSGSGLLALGGLGALLAVGRRRRKSAD